MGSRIARGLAAASAVGAALAMVVLVVGPGWDVETGGFAVAGLAYGLTGVVVTWRLPRNAVGWLLAPTGFAMVSGSLVEAHLYAIAGSTTIRSVDVFAGWWDSVYWLPFLLVQFIVLPMVFPTGRAVSRGWGRVLRLAVALVGAGTVAVALAREIDLIDAAGQVFHTASNPLGLVPGSGDEIGPGVSLVILPFVLVALASLPSRFRRSTAVERAQMKVVVLGLVGVVGGYLVTVVADLLLGFGDANTGLPPVADLVVPLVVPGTILVAMTRHRLWDVDRLVSRTVAWTLLTGVLVVSYAAVVLAGQAAAGREESSDLAVAAATLVAAALFRPVRGRLQRLVDRRFDRARYAAVEVVDGFGARLRDEVTVPGIEVALRSTTARVLAPASVSLWTAGHDGGEGRRAHGR